MYQRMKMLLGGLILSTGLLVATPVSYAAETQVNGEYRYIYSKQFLGGRYRYEKRMYK